MKAKDGAKDLIYKMWDIDNDTDYPMVFETAKQCALVAAKGMRLVAFFNGNFIQMNCLDDIINEIIKFKKPF